MLFKDSGEVIVRDLGSTNGIRINGQRVDNGRLRVGDELSIAHIRYRLDDGLAQELTVAGEASSPGAGREESMDFRLARPAVGSGPHRAGASDRGADNPLAAAVRDLLPPGVGDRCRIQVIVQMQPTDDPSGSDPCASPASSSSGEAALSGASHHHREGGGAD